MLGILACHHTGLLLPEQFRCRDMGCLRRSSTFEPGFFRSARTFAIGGEANLPRQHLQGGDELCGGHTAEDPPLLLRDGHHHALIRLGDLVGDLIEREVRVNGVLAVDAAQCRQHDRQHIVRDEGETKAKQRGFGIT